MSEQNENLSPRQHRAILALLKCASVEKAALDCKVSSKTLRRWLREASFREAYVRAGERLFEQGLGQLQWLASFAVAKLAQALVNGSVGQTLRAAEIVFTHGRSAVNLKLDAMVKLQGQYGVLLAPGSAATAQDWCKLYASVEQYQNTLGQAGDSDTKKAKPQTKENDGVS